MSFDNTYPNRKDHRKTYNDGRDADRTCRAGGSCPWCQRGRQYKHKRRKGGELTNAELRKESTR